MKIVRRTITSASVTRFFACYVVAIDPATRNVIELGRPPKDLVLDFDQIIGG